jgi:pimeloyl-ACP methyl ester carboxylesterase
MRGEFIDLGGGRIYYYAAGTRGAGEPVVLIHGFPTSSSLWADVVPLLPSGHRVVCLDLLGYGRSDPPTPGNSVGIRAHAERTIALMDALGIEFACIAGHDVGGGVAQAMAVRWPHRVSRLCLIDSVAFDEWPTRGVKMARAMVPLTRHLPAPWILGVLRSDLLAGYADREKGGFSVNRYTIPFGSPGGRDALLQHLSELDPCDTSDLAPRLRTLVQPTSIVWGEGDPFLPISLARRLHQAIPQSTLDVVDGGRHFIPEESPGRVADAIASLLERR